jgi:hypothetical protein
MLACVRSLDAKLYIWSNGRAPSGTLGKSADDDPDFDFSHYRRSTDLTGSRCFVTHRARWQFTGGTRLFFFLLLFSR